MVQAHPPSHCGAAPPAPDGIYRHEEMCFEREPLLASSRQSYGSSDAAAAAAAAESGGHPQEGTWTYRSRFWILICFSLMCWVHDVQWIIWGPISESMDAAFPGWGPSTVALMVNWGTILYVVFFIPMCWMVQRFGLRVSVVSSFAVMTVGAALRCITSTTPAFTILCHLGGMAGGVASPVMLAAPTLIASDWFPLRERTTAMAIMVGAHQLGGVASYLEPLIVRQPGPGVTQEDIKQDVMRLLYIAAGMAAVLLVAVVAYFPSKPPSTPSVTSSEERIRFLPALKKLVRNKKFMLLLVCYGVFVGPSVMWLPVIDYSLLPLGFHQNKAMWVGLAGVVASSVFPIISGRLNDLLRPVLTRPDFTSGRAYGHSAGNFCDVINSSPDSRHPEPGNSRALPHSGTAKMSVRTKMDWIYLFPDAEGFLCNMLMHLNVLNYTIY